MALTGKLLIAATLLLSLTTNAAAADKFITVASTTSAENSGLFREILPQFKQKTGIAVRVVAQGTGQALDTGRRCDADVVFVHDPASEEKFVAEGHGVKRHGVMYNDFVLVGPKSDPAGVAGGKDITIALKKIANTKTPFASRGDNSGTHKAERRLWQAAGIDLEKAKGPWYREMGSGMGATLNTAAQMNAYLLTDRGTWLSFKNPVELAILVEGDTRLFNPYSVILVNPTKCPNVKKDLGQAFIDWLVSPEGQKAIGAYQIGGKQLFFPNTNANS
ncbi:extracellular solute-binding protein family 1 [Nitrosococcus halophilus Nc 4]|uniref:Extracellular solute-binding protein family 1 n=1 Tax=Nitrosococcus halophilus (strain Nc4) TaxID=472759 RepID=D5BW45_NITHN|nr:substrate-binding domain-containing protein [Nitrosococcus halophilus]ADE13695.1 extracellular solute-binding protein family 1 [Nitrosococcus halophilus Nc 4]